MGNIFSGHSNGNNQNKQNSHTLTNQQQAYNDAATAALMAGLSGSAQVGAAVAANPAAYQ